jgi:hypothetical protein
MTPAGPGLAPSLRTTALDFLLRLAFFSAAPFAIVSLAALFPVTGALVQVGLALGVFLAGEATRKLTARSKLAAFVLASQLEFEAYYRAHPPRPFLYYVFYPALFPYWLVAREARREFLLFKGYTIVSFLLLLASLGLQYLRSFPPDLSVRDFIPIAVGSFVAEAVVVLMLLMPIVTSVVHFHTQRAPVPLAVLLVAGIVSISFAIARLERRRDPIVSYATRARVRLRTAARPDAANEAQTIALRAAWRALPQDKNDVDGDGKIEGKVLDQAHEALSGFYKSDEATAFDVWYAKSGTSALMVVYFEARRGHRPIWLAMNRSGLVIDEPSQLPRGAFLAMWRATR